MSTRFGPKIRPMNTAKQISLNIFGTGMALQVIPTHHGLTVALMTLTGLIGAALVCKMFTTSSASVF